MLKISKRQAWDFCFNEPVLLEKPACCVHLARTHGAFVWDWSFQVLRPPSHGRESFFAYSQLVAKAFLRRILELDPHDSVSIVIATRVLTVCILDNKVNQWHIFLFWVHGLCLCSEGYRWRLPKPFFAIFFASQVYSDFVRSKFLQIIRRICFLYCLLRRLLVSPLICLTNE